MDLSYTLKKDVVEDHESRISYLIKYLPFFRLQEMSLSLFKEGKYAMVDMGYLLMAVLRFFIEENHFNDRYLTYGEIFSFIRELLVKDFNLTLDRMEEKELIDYIFNKIKNDGKPFEMDYFNPADKKKKTARMKLIEARIHDHVAEYMITADAIEFYLETKEVKEESRISIQQLLLAKMIASKNFKGGTEVIKRINSEVRRLNLKKEEVLTQLSFDVFEGIRQLDEFSKSGMQWFNEEQKAFLKNKELLDQAMSKAESTERENRGQYSVILAEIYELEKELKKAMSYHSALLSDCMELQVKADEMVRRYKFSRLRNAFDFNAFLSASKKGDDVSSLLPVLTPFFLPQIRKSFTLLNVDELLTYPPVKEEEGEEILEQKEENYRFEDEIEEERISENFESILKVFLSMFLKYEEFSLSELNRELELTFFDEIFKNSDYYSFLVHLCQKREYDLSELQKKQETFLDALLVSFLLKSQNEKFRKLKFRVDSVTDNTEEGMITHLISKPEGEISFSTTDLKFLRLS